MAMYCCWYAADRLRRASGVEYDMIVRARGDLLIEGAIPLQYLNIQGSILTHIRNDINDPMWINDIMFASDPDTMTILCDLYQYYGALFDELSSQNAPQWFFSSHKLIPYYLMARGTAWTEVEFPFKRFNHCLVR
jgi:hypothetical protein